MMQEDSDWTVMRKAILEHLTTKVDPLQYIRTIDMVLEAPQVEGGDFPIVAMNIDGDCVVRKWRHD